MEKALLDGKIIYASEIAKDYESDANLRKISANNKNTQRLKCPNEDCPNPLIKYCNGNKKGAYFSHVKESNCSYSIFDRNDTPTKKSLRYNLYEIFKEQGLNVDIELPITQNHYCQIQITFEDNEKLAIEYGTKHTTVQEYTYINNLYKNLNITPHWLFIGNDDFLEINGYALQRYCLNEEQNEIQCIIIPKQTSYSKSSDISQLKLLPNKHNFKFKGKLEDLKIIDKKLTLPNFDLDYNNESKTINNILKQSNSLITKSFVVANTSEEKINARIDNPFEISYDNHGNRIFRCIICENPLYDEIKRNGLISTHHLSKYNYLMPINWYICGYCIRDVKDSIEKNIPLCQFNDIPQKHMYCNDPALSANNFPYKEAKCLICNKETDSDGFCIISYENKNDKTIGIGICPNCLTHINNF